MIASSAYPYPSRHSCLCASGYSTGVSEIEDRFGVSSEIGTLGLSLYLVRFLSFIIVQKVHVVHLLYQTDSSALQPVSTDR